METTFKIVGIDVHKSMLAVVVADAAAEGEFQFERRKFGTTESALRQLAQWLAERNVRHAGQASINPRPGADSQPAGIAAGGWADQAVRLCQRLAGSQ